MTSPYSHPANYPRLREALIARYGTSQETVDDIGSIKTTRTIWGAESETIELIHVDIVALGNTIAYLDYSDSLTDLSL